MCYMEAIGVRELRQHASRYLEQVADGATIEITNHGKAVARLVPIHATAPTWADLIVTGVVTPGRGSVLDVVPLPAPPTTPSNQELLDEMRGDT